MESLKYQYNFVGIPFFRETRAAGTSLAVNITIDGLDVGTLLFMKLLTLFQSYLNNFTKLHS